jgi:serine/threonine protein kinase
MAQRVTLPVCSPPNLLGAYGWAVDGTPFGRYRLIELIGRGGMGEVWRAHDTVTDRVVAIKLLPANFSENVEFQERFRREAHAAARLNTPHVVPIYDYGEIEGRLFVSMRLIEGRDLQAVVADGPLEPSRAVRIIEQVALALQAAHEVGLLHRDVKPSNILLDRNDFAYLIDFGLARAADQTRLTQSGCAIGTFAYMAPERLDARANEDARADIYSLACVLCECLTGHPPFDADTTPQVIAAHLHAPPPRPSTSRPNVPALIDQVIAKGMAKDPHNRYATTIELAHAAHDAITAPIPRPKPTVPPAGVGEAAPPPMAAAQYPPSATSTPNSAPTMRVGQQAPAAPPTPRPAPRYDPSARTMMAGAGSSQPPPPSWPPYAGGPSRPPPAWAPPQQPPQPAPAGRSRTPWIIAGAAAAVVVLVAVIAIVASQSGARPSSAPTSSQVVPGLAARWQIHSSGVEANLRTQSWSLGKDGLVSGSGGNGRWTFTNSTLTVTINDYATYTARVVGSHLVDGKAHNVTGYNWTFTGDAK